MAGPRKEELIASFQDTMNLAWNGELMLQTQAAVENTRIYPENFRASGLYTLRTTKYSVEETTSFAAAESLAGMHRVAVLNFANPHYPGGGVTRGAMAQEECLCRSSNLYACLSARQIQEDYYTYNREHTDYFFSDRLVYSRDVTVFKSDDPLPKLRPRERWFRVDVITCAAPFLAQRKHTNRAALKETFIDRIRNILEAAIDNGAEALVLGAFGCGAFRNPPEVVAAAFRSVLQEQRYRAAFSRVIFAIRRSVGDLEICPNLVAFQQQILGFSRELGKQIPLDRSEPRKPTVILPGGRVLDSADSIGAYEKWKKNNRWYGRQFSVLGDSVSTLEGYNPKGYRVFYREQTCGQTGVTEMADTWWGKVIDFFGGELLVNNAWSGSRVSSPAQSEAQFPAGCSSLRTGKLHIGTVKPDVILVYMGINDWASGARIGDTDSAAAPDYRLFDYAYSRMLKNLRANYPEAEIWCSTLCGTYMESDEEFRFPTAYGGTELTAFNRQIRRIARAEGCICLDTAELGLHYDSVDGTHPTDRGMDTLAALMIRKADPVAAEFLNCRNGIHENVEMRNQNGSYRYVCQKCGCVYDKPAQTWDDKPAGITGRLPELGNTAGDGLYLWLKHTDQQVLLPCGRHLVGRGVECTLRLLSPYAARKQAVVSYEAGRWYIRDHNSKNGTFVNGVRLKSGEAVELHRGDVINFARREVAEVR